MSKRDLLLKARAYVPVALQDEIDAALQPKPSVRRKQTAVLRRLDGKLALMDWEERKAYFKRTAPLEDAKFLARAVEGHSIALILTVQKHVIDIEDGRAGTPSAIHAQTRRLQEQWRVERLATERLAAEQAAA